MNDDLCECETKKAEIHVLFECKCYTQLRRRWIRVWDGLDEKERALDVIKKKLYGSE